MKLKQIVSICCMAATLLLAALAPVSADELKPADELLRLARQFEASDLSDAKEVYKALIDTYPKSREAATARQRLAAADKAEKQKQAAEVKKQAAEAKAKALQEYREAFKNARSSDELDTFIKTYTGKDPDKLIPKARQMKAAAEKRERQERAESERKVAHACDRLYNGKKVSVKLQEYGLFIRNMVYYQAVVLGSGNGLATIKVLSSDRSGEVIEVSCSDI
jgi:hypothetical protein